VTGPSDGNTNTYYAFTAHATDPENDQIRYGFDWNMDGVADIWTPYVNSGTYQTEYQSWNDRGDHTFQVLAQDAPGLNSPWTSFTITLSDNSVSPSVELNISPNNIHVPAYVNLMWTTTNTPTSCEGTGGSPGWAGTKSPYTVNYQTLYVDTPGTYFYSIICYNSAGSYQSGASLVASSNSVGPHSVTSVRTYGGTVISTDGQIWCGSESSACSHTYASGSSVILTATPSTAQWEFGGWTGACSGKGSCVLIVDSDKTVTPLFILHPLKYVEF
jgi:hypothetical protein